MDGGICVGLELASEEPFVLLGELLRLLDHPEAFERPGREDDLRTEKTHQLAPLDREAVRHGDDQRVTFGGAHHRKPYAGVAARSLDDGLARPQRSIAFGGLDDA